MRIELGWFLVDWIIVIVGCGLLWLIVCGGWCYGWCGG